MKHSVAKFTFNVFAFLSVFSLPNTVFAWGDLGHRVVGQIATEHLSPSAAKAVEAILGKTEDLAEAATFPDWVRSDRMFNFMSPFHFIDAPPGADLSKMPVTAVGNVWMGIHFMTEVLKGHPEVVEGFVHGLPGLKNSRGEPLYDEAQIRFAKEAMTDKRVALRYLAHMIGDLHQPLHVGNGRDMGGNLCVVRWMGELNMLHALWDEDLVESSGLSYTEYTRHIMRDSLEMKKKQLESIARAPLKDWIQESRALRSTVYPQTREKENVYVDEMKQPYCFERGKPVTLKDGEKLWVSFSKYDRARLQSTVEKLIKGGVLQDTDVYSDIPKLEYAYRYKMLPLAEERLLHAGLRLSHVLNTVFP